MAVTGGKTILLSSEFGASPVETEEEAYSKTAIGFDTLVKSYWGACASAYAANSFAETNLGIGTTLGGFSYMFIDNVSIAKEGDTIYKFTCTAKGLLGTKPMISTVSTRTQTYSTDSVNVPGGSSGVQAQGRYQQLQATFNIVTATPPDFSQVGKQSPALIGTMPTPATNLFTSTPTTAIYNYPYGWVLESIEQEDVAGQAIYMLKYDYVYIFQYVPG